MNSLVIAKFAALTACCLIATYTDLKYGKIKNKLLLIFGITAIVLDAVSLYLYTPDETLIFAKNAAVLCLMALVLYMVRVWAGGDCKFLIVVALLYPIECYWHIEGQQLTLWFLVCIMFSVGFVYLAAESVWLGMKNGTEKAGFRGNLKQAINRYFRALIYLAAIGHIWNYFVIEHFNVPAVIYTCICIILIWWLNSKEIYYSNVLTTAVLLFDVLMMIMTKTLAIRTGWITYVIAILSMVMREYIKQFDYMTIPSAEAEKGMILSQASSLLLQNSKVKGLPGVSDETLRSRLTEEEAESIRRWSKTSKGTETVCIVRKMPFAVFVLLGVAVYTIIGSMLK